MSRHPSFCTPYIERQPDRPGRLQYYDARTKQWLVDDAMMVKTFQGVPKLVTRRRMDCWGCGAPWEPVCSYCKRDNACTHN